MVMLDVLRLLIAVIVAFFAGKLISRLRLPSILGWLITGMVLGPHALGFSTTMCWTADGLMCWKVFWNVPSV